MPTLSKELLKKTAKLLLGEYSIYQVYSQSDNAAVQPHPVAETHYRVKEIDITAIGLSLEPLIKEQAHYAGPGSHVYACFDESRIVGICFYWFGVRYLERDFWPLADGEAKLVQIISLPDMRGRGVATAIIGSSSNDMLKKDYRRLYARVWHSNTPSARAFERAGWKRIALVIEINPLRRNRPVRFRFNYSII